MTRVLRLAPCNLVRGEGFVLASWPLAPGGSVDAQRSLAWVGTLRGISDRLELADAARLPGEYALILGRPDGLVMARGRHAGRCLYFARGSAGSVIACSRLEPLLACLTGVSPNVRTLASVILATHSDDSSATAVEGVRRVESSQAILVGTEGLVRTFRAPLEVCARDGSPEDLASELRSTVQRVVARAIQGARRVAVLTGGGLDSSCVLASAIAEARGAKGSEVAAVALSFAGPGDDRPHLTELCDALGIVPVRLAPPEASGDVIRGLTADASPFIWPTAAWHLQAAKRMRERGVDLVLTGQGGDLVFGGDPRTLARRVWSRDWYRAIARVFRFDRPPTSLGLPRAAKLLLTPPIQSNLAVLSRLKRHRAAARKWSWTGPRLRDAVRDWVREPPNRDWTTLTGQMKFTRVLKKDFMLMAETCGQMEAATALRRVDPLVDDELVELVAGFPQESLLFGDRQRGLLRQAMRDVLPERVRLRPDKARFEPAISEMVRRSDLRALRDLSQMRMLGDLGLVDPPRYRRHFEAVLSEGPASRDWLAVWPALSAEAFLRLHWGPRSQETL